MCERSSIPRRQSLVPIPRGYVIGCAVSLPILAWLAFWRPRITTPIAVGIASLTGIVLRGEFYGRGLGLFSLRSLQSLAIWTLIFTAAVLVRVAVMRRQPS